MSEKKKSNKKNLLVTYQGAGEVLVCLKSYEDKFLKEYFDSSCGRDVEEYDRSEGKVVEINPSIDAFVYPNL